MGDGHDYSAQVPGLISQATGTFQHVSPNITEKGKVDNAGSKVANIFSLQLNTQFFTTPACAASGDPAKCRGWQQFLYAPSGGTGYVFMQYWLLNYAATCPSGWSPASGDCFINSAASTVTGGPLTAKDLATVRVSGSATSGGEDEVSLSAGSGQASLVTNNDSELDLAAAWNTTEWGVFGDGGGGEAFFGTGTTLEAQTTVTTTRSSAPACVKEGFTAETNNLQLASTPALGSKPSPTMASRQTNGTSGTASCAVASGSGWAATKAPLPANAGSDPGVQIDSVACPSTTSCVAAGTYTDSSGGVQGLLLSGSGGSWTAMEAPLPANAGSSPAVQIASVACPSTTSCVAAGTYTGSSNYRKPLLVTGSGGSWTAAKVPLPANAGSPSGGQIYSVVCPSVTRCAAAGSYSGGDGGLLLTGSGTSWTAKEAPLPAGASGDQVTLTSVACPAATSCVAAGTYDSYPYTKGLLLTRAGNSWTAMKAPLPANAASRDPAVRIDSLACSSSASCIVAGYYYDRSFNPRPVLFTGSGRSWTVVEAPLPANAIAKSALGDPASVACSSTATTCLVVGRYELTSGQWNGMLITGSGTLWKAVETPLPPDVESVAPWGYLAAVACPSLSSCVAAGTYLDTSADEQGVLVRGAA